MEGFDKLNIKLKSSDEKGMLDANTIIEFLQKAKKAICEVKLSNGFNSGFFCKMPFKKNNSLLLPVLITENYNLSKDFIEIIINGETKILSLKQRKIWHDEEIGFTCIEIKEKEDNIHTFFNLDYNVLNNNYDNDCYLNENVIIYGIKKIGKKVGFSIGNIKEIRNYFFYYTCNAYPSYSGGCIVNQSNNRVIGFHKGGIESENKEQLNLGIFIRSIIKKVEEILIKSVNYNFKVFLVNKEIFFSLF